MVLGRITDLTVIRGGVTEEGCAMLVNQEASRVVYKNNYSFGVKIFNIYMVRFRNPVFLTKSY